MWERSRAEQSFGGGVRYCQMRKPRKKGLPSLFCPLSAEKQQVRPWEGKVSCSCAGCTPLSINGCSRVYWWVPTPSRGVLRKMHAISSGMVPPFLLFQTLHKHRRVLASTNCCKDRISSRFSVRTPTTGYRPFIWMRSSFNFCAHDSWPFMLMTYPGLNPGPT